MPRSANAHHLHAWNGWEAKLWVEHADRYNAMAAGFTHALLRAASLGERDWVLDIGCGTGQTTLLAAQQAVHGRAVGVDLSAPMLAKARADATTHGIANIEFVQADAQTHPFPTGRFDVVISRAALMLFSDLTQGFANLAGGLRPGGRLVFTCPSPADPDSDYARATAPLHPFMRSLSPTQHGMNALNDRAQIPSVLDQAGFTKVTVDLVEVPVILGYDASDATDVLLATGPVRYNLTGLHDETIKNIRDQVEARLQKFATTDGIVVKRSNQLVTATRPRPPTPHQTIRTS